MATARVMARTTGAFYAMGGTAVLALASVTGPRTDGRVLAVIGVVALTVALLLLVGGERLPRATFHVAVLGGTCLISLAVLAAPDPASAVAAAAIYVFVAVDSFLFFAWAPATAQFGLALVAQVGCLAAVRDVPAAVAVCTTLVCLAVAAVTGLLVQRASSASRDGLTGLLNRRGFDGVLDATRPGDPVALALLDLDRFKQVNDSHGHGAGDLLLRSVAVACRRAVPAATAVARLGGDEFALLLATGSSARALAGVEAVRAALPGCGFSAGVAVRADGESAADLLRRADAALYAAKAGGRGRSVLSGGDTSRVAVDLAAALAAGHVTVALQPIVSLADGGTVGVEALARWRDPVRGPVSPAEFVPAAEAAGLVGELGATVLRSACTDAGRLAAAWGRRVLLTVNVSGQELVCPDYAERVLQTLADTGWDPRDLVVEVTESLLEASSSPALGTLARLRRHGIGVAIDDFGTGWSSFSRLDTLPADYLKLDATFLATSTTSPRRAGMLRALLELGDTLGLTVVAEGVETAEQERLLVHLGCPLVQGWLYSAARPVDELVAAGPVPAPALR
ncbi:putative bifunctional diguanylate cyclase/phosphodiesterase [Geodermatophilus telluris]|uniref:putative bifunctional diguanylate cyclase/phosphodiesterase n=1 Tax=Geodermatophilus telluris TaxID=1190417 RepID=UPI001114173C|nr:bifunctional diguanylate cyclase/phosphodiesterase [Geodermatophilus telluris]